MRRRGFFALLAAALALAVLAVVAVWRGDRGVSHAPVGQRALPELADKLGALARLRLTRGPMTINFAMTDHRWTIIDKGNYPADQDRVRKLLLQLAELELIEPKTDRPELLGRLDLDDPANGKSTLVAAQDRSGASRFTGRGSKAARRGDPADRRVERRRRDPRDAPDTGAE